MKILVENETGLVKYAGHNYFLLTDITLVYNLENLSECIDGTLNSGNSTIYEIDDIEDFVGNKYLYVNEEIALNPDYIDPEVLE